MQHLHALNVSLPRRLLTALSIPLALLILTLFGGAAPTYAVNCNPGNGAGLVAAVAAGCPVIQLAAKVYNANGMSTVSDVSIVGAGQSATIIDGGGSQVFYNGSYTLHLSKLTIRNGGEATYGGAVGNNAATYGGAVGNEAMLMVQFVTFLNNRATYGGAIYMGGSNTMLMVDHKYLPQQPGIRRRGDLWEWTGNDRGEHLQKQHRRVQGRRHLQE